MYRMIKYDSYDTHLRIIWFMSTSNMLLRYEIFCTWHDMIFIVRYTKTIFIYIYIYMISPPLVKNGWLWAPCVITQSDCYTVCNRFYLHSYVFSFFCFSSPGYSFLRNKQLILFLENIICCVGYSSLTLNLN